ncbi:MAG: 5-deoxy-glucuronate isomerase [Vagococcus sp.]
MTSLKRIPENKNLDNNVIQKHHITREKDGLKFIELRLLDCYANSYYEELLEGLEVCAVILEGKASISDGDKKFENIGGRDSIFEKNPTDSVYMSSGKLLQIRVDHYAKLILCYAPSLVVLPTTLIKAESNVIEKRGNYNNKRLVHNILDDESVISDKLLVVEVYTDSGNWSSYPPHKHDQDNLPYESLLEETYYHEMNPKQGFVFHRVYTEDRSIDDIMAVENENVVIVPKGYHPVSVPDGYDSYYLNIMAGPVKKWKFHNDPAHEWILNRK